MGKVFLTAKGEYFIEYARIIAAIESANPTYYTQLEYVHVYVRVLFGLSLIRVLT